MGGPNSGLSKSFSMKIRTSFSIFTFDYERCQHASQSLDSCIFARLASSCAATTLTLSVKIRLLHLWLYLSSRLHIFHSFRLQRYLYIMIIGDAGYYYTTRLGCQYITECVIGHSYETVAPTGNSDRVCELVSVCRKTEYELSPPTLISDRDCQPLSVCVVGVTYETIPSSKNSDRFCSPATPPCDRATSFVTFRSISVHKMMTSCPNRIDSTIIYHLFCLLYLY